MDLELRRAREDDLWPIVRLLGDDPLGRLRETTMEGGGERAQIEAVRVAPSLRSQGVGRRTIEWAIGQAQARGCHLVQLTTDRRRSGARRFYESLGFKATHDGMKLHL